MNQGYKINCCAGCALPRPTPVETDDASCPTCGSLQTLLMRPGARQAVAEAYRVRLLAQLRPLLPSDIALKRADDLERYFGQEATNAP